MTGAERLAQSVLSRLVEQGVREFCVCPGARNAPFIALLAGSGLESRYFYEERSAAFFALGRARRTGAPVAVITTSGTAAGELLPATMEAHYTGVPLVLVTADRPRSYRHTGAPQTAVQPDIFGIYASESLDLEEECPALRITDEPIHLNVCFDEPLVSSSEARGGLSRLQPACFSYTPAAGADLSRLTGFFAGLKKPIAIVSGLVAAEEREGTLRFLVENGIPAYLEATSGLREDPRLSNLRIHQADRLMERAARAGYEIDGILRIGSIPTHRLWRDLEAKLVDLPVASVSALPFSGLSRANLALQASPARLGDIKLFGTGGTPPREWAQRFLAEDRAFQGALEELLVAHPSSEPSLFRALSRSIVPGSHVHVGNSLPIREWDLAAVYEARGLEITASRGLNGIDGQVSTFLGQADATRDNWAILGDLTALYDLAGPWALRALGDIRARICVINNGGGKIFDRMFAEREFQNNHPVRFKAWAELWGLPFEEWDTIPAQAPLVGASIVEVRPDEESTRAFWGAYAKL